MAPWSLWPTSEPALEQRLSRVHEVFDPIDLPRQVVEADGAADRARRTVSDREQPEVVIVLGAPSAQEGGAHRLPVVVHGLETEDISVERDRPFDITDVKHGMIEAAHGDGRHARVNT